MLIYIHVPFCLSRCAYCAFYSTPLGKGANPLTDPRLRDYVDSLFLEIALLGDRYGGRTAQSVFFGGGTPSLLPPAIIGAILERIGRSFRLASKAEVTMEANPESLRGRGNLEGYLAAGVNRLSIGIQSLDDGMLRLLGRPHKAIEGLRAIDAARAAGFANIGVDLMWGLPGQSVRQWLETIKEMCAIGPDHISSYGLTLEPGTPLEAECESGSLTLPPDRDQSIMYVEGAARLEAAGYLQYEISNFARMGYQCRHNLGYWEGADYLGLGPSATSTVGNRRWTSPASLKSWSERVASGADAFDTEILEPQTRALELIMLRLRTTRGMRLKAYRDLTGRDFIKDNKRFMQALHENGLARVRNGYLSLTRSGMLVSNSVISNIFERVKHAFGGGMEKGGKSPEKIAPPSLGKAEPQEPDISLQPEAGLAAPAQWREATGRE